MQAWESIQKTVDYIEENLEKPFDIAELARMAALSPFYYQRLFSRLVEKPVREYIKLRRLNKASAMLESGNRRIIDIALECGFSSHESLTRAFREAYGLTPAQYRKDPVMLNQFDKPDLSLGYVVVDEGVPLISEGLILEFNRKRLEKPIRFMGFEGHIPIEGQMPLGKKTGIDLPGEIWERFHREKHRAPSAQNAREIGVAYFGDAPAGWFTYFVGIEVQGGEANPEFKTFELPAREYVVCGFEAESFEELVGVALNKAVVYGTKWFKARGLVTGEYSPEIYYKQEEERAYMELWMPAELAKKPG